MIEVWCKKAWNDLASPRQKLAAKTRDIFEHLSSRRSGIVLTITMPALVVCWHLVALAGRPAHLNKIVAELQSLQSFGGLRSDFMPSNDGTRLLCLKGAGDGIGVGLFFCKIGNQQQKLIYQEKSGQPSMPSETFLGWSPDDHFFAYGRRGRWNYLWEIIIADGETGDTLATMPLSSRALSGAWLSSRKLAFLNEKRVLFTIENSQTTWSTPKFFEYFKYSTNRLGNELIQNLSAFDSNSVVWQQGNAIWKCGDRSPAPEKIWDAGPNKLFEYSVSGAVGKFLVHCQDATGQFLGFFDSGRPTWPTDITRIDLAKYHPEHLTFINDGKGYAYMSQIGPTNMLVIKSEDFRAPVECQWPDQIVKFAASQHQIFVNSSFPAGPMAIGRYDVTSGSLQCVVPIAESPYDYLTNCTVTQNEITNTAGQTVTYYLCKSSKPGDSKKHTLLLGPPSTKPIWYQFYGALAQGGNYFAYIALNDRDSSGASDDILAVYENLAKRPDVDIKNVYLYGVSGSTTAECELLESKPGLWKGAILYGPVSLPDPLKIAGQRLFIDTGEDDPFFGQEGLQFQEKAAEVGIPVTLLIHPGEAHVFKQPETFCERMRETLIFLGGQ